MPMELARSTPVAPLSTRIPSTITMGSLVSERLLEPRMRTRLPVPVVPPDDSTWTPGTRELRRSATLLGAGTGHDHDIEGYRCRRKRKVEGRGFARPHRYRLRRGGVADESDLHIVATGGHTGDGVAAFAAGETLQVCADDQNLRPAHRLLVRFVRHLAGHAALLGGARARDTDQQRAKPQERE